MIPKKLTRSVSVARIGNKARQYAAIDPHTLSRLQCHSTARLRVGECSCRGSCTAQTWNTIYSKTRNVFARSEAVGFDNTGLIDFARREFAVVRSDHHNAVDRSPTENAAVAPVMRLMALTVVMTPRTELNDTRPKDATLIAAIPPIHTNVFFSSTSFMNLTALLSARTNCHERSQRKHDPLWSDDRCMMMMVFVVDGVQKLSRLSTVASPTCCRMCTSLPSSVYTYIQTSMLLVNMTFLSGRNLAWKYQIQRTQLHASGISIPAQGTLHLTIYMEKVVGVPRLIMDKMIT